MFSPRTRAAALISTLALAGFPAFAETSERTEEVQIVIDLDAPADEIYRSVRDQAFCVCKSDDTNAHPAARAAVRRDCQKGVVADVMRQLGEADEVQFATDTHRAN